MIEELKAKFKEIAGIIYGEDEIAIECAIEDAETNSCLFVCFDDYTEFEARFSDVEEACWARGLVIEREGGGFAVKEDGSPQMNKTKYERG